MKTCSNRSSHNSNLSSKWVKSVKSNQEWKNIIKIKCQMVILIEQKLFLLFKKSKASMSFSLVCMFKNMMDDVQHPILDVSMCRIWIQYISFVQNSLSYRCLSWNLNWLFGLCQTIRLCLCSYMGLSTKWRWWLYLSLSSSRTTCT